MVSTFNTDVFAKPAGSRSTNTLQLIFIASRHGNRCPVNAFPNYPHPTNNTDLWPYGQGHLTKVGLRQMARLGETVRALYNGFLDQIYHPEAITALSSPVVRTIMSAQAFLSGLYPPTGPQVWNKDLMWQPIPVLPSEMLDLEMTEEEHSKLCPSLTRDRNKHISRFEQENELTIKEVAEFVEPFSGKLPGQGAMMMLYLWDSLKMAERESLPLPDWTERVYPEPLTTLATEVCKISVTATDLMIRLYGGRIFKHIIESMQAKAQGFLHPDRRVYYYSGHDETVSALKAVLGLSTGDIPETGSALVLELHKDPLTHDHYVQVVYLDGKSPDLVPVPVNLPDCHHPCLLSSLMSFTDKYYNITDYNRECQYAKTHNVNVVS